MTQIVEFRVVYMHPQRVNIPLQGIDRCALTVGARPNINKFNDKTGYLLARLVVQKLSIITLSWGNKMNFSLRAKMSGFYSDSHIYYILEY